MPPVTSSPALGLDADGRQAKHAWHIAADTDDGPEIPCIAAILLARRLAAGDHIAADAHTAAGLLILDVFAPEFKKWSMVTNVEDEIGELGVGSAS